MTGLSLFARSAPRSPEAHIVRAGDRHQLFLPNASQLFDIDAELALSRWYSQQRLPLVSTLDCVVRTRKLVSSVGWAKHAVLYEFASVVRRLKEYEEPHESKTLVADAWTGKIASSALYPPGSPFVGERIWPSIT